MAGLLTGDAEDTFFKGDLPRQPFLNDNCRY